MAENSKIEWCDHTFSPWVGCQKVSPGCDHCYAESWSKRSGLVVWGAHGKRQRTSETTWTQLQKWDRQAAASGKRATVFPSLCDPFDNQVPPEWRADYFAEIRATPNLIHMLLTKRPQNIIGMCEAASGSDANRALPPNVALGASAEDQDRANQRIPELLYASATLGPLWTFVSCEPLLGPIDLTRFDYAPSAPRINQVIAGGESGPQSRPMHPDWPLALLRQCHSTGTAFFFKQWGEWGPDEGPPVGGRDRIMDGSVRCAVWGGRAWSYYANGYGPATDSGQGRWVYRLGKKAAGRLLNGSEWNEMPEVHK